MPKMQIIRYLFKNQLDAWTIELQVFRLILSNAKILLIFSTLGAENQRHHN
jgi:hypothetical protein